MRVGQHVLRNEVVLGLSCFFALSLSHLLELLAGSVIRWPATSETQELGPGVDGLPALPGPHVDSVRFFEDSA